MRMLVKRLTLLFILAISCTQERTYSVESEGVVEKTGVHKAEGSVYTPKPAQNAPTTTPPRESQVYMKNKTNVDICLVTLENKKLDRVHNPITYREPLEPNRGKGKSIEPGEWSIAASDCKDEKTLFVDHFSVKKDEVKDIFIIRKINPMQP